MNNVFKTILKKEISIALCGAIAFSCTPITSSMVKQDGLLNAEAINLSVHYIKYSYPHQCMSTLDYDKNSVIYHSMNYLFYYYPYQMAHRNADGIPEANNCTVVCVQNLLEIYRRTNGKGLSSSAGRNYLYNQLIDLARKKYGYKDASGLPLTSHRTFCQSVMKKYGGFNGTPNVDTYSLPNRWLSENNLPKKPFIISSSGEDHSILVFAMNLIHFTYTKNGQRMTKDVPVLYCLDPEGDIFYLVANHMVDSVNDMEQIMYVANYDVDYGNYRGY